MDPNSRQPKTLQSPLLALLLAATILAKSSHAKPFLLGYGQSPWIPLKHIYNYLPPLPSLWHPIAGSYPQYNQQYLTTSSPQLQPPPLNQQQIIHIHDIPPLNIPTEENFEPLRERNHHELATNIRNLQHSEEDEESFEKYESTSDNNTFSSPSLTTESDYESLHSREEEEVEEDGDAHINYDITADASNITYSIVKLISVPENTTERNITDIVTDDPRFKENITETTATLLEKTESSTELFEIEGVNDYSASTNKRYRRTTPRTSVLRRNSARRPVHDYGDFRNRNRKNPIRRRTTTLSYDEYSFSDKQINHRKRRPPSKTRNRPNRRPINKDAEYYDNEYDEDEYDDYYQNGVNIFARQGIDEDTSSTDTSTTITTTTTSGSTDQTTTTAATTIYTFPTTNQTFGYTYGPPNTGYGAPGQTGYGPSNGNEHISITYPPISGPDRDVLSPLIDALYNQYSKHSVIRRLQELLQPNNFYNNQQYDVNYPDNF